MGHYQQCGATQVPCVPTAVGDGIPQLPSFGEGLPLLLQEINHRIRNILAMIESVVGQTESTTVEDYRNKLLARISGLGDFYEVICRLDGDKIGLADLLQQTVRPYFAAGGRIVAAGPDIDIEPRLALSLHLVLHELANNAMKYGALTSICGTIDVAWEIKQVGASRKLAIVWSEDGGPIVKQPERRGFGSRLITRTLAAHGEVQLVFRPVGVACYMLIDLDQDLRASDLGVLG